MFQPFYEPAQMWELGVFDQCYFDEADLPACLVGVRTPNRNRYASRVGSSRLVWQMNGWIHPQDPLGWFQWYCRYHEGRRTDDDHRQIGRWSSFGARHGAQVVRHGNGDVTLRCRQRQGLLHWAHDPEPDLTN